MVAIVGVRTTCRLRADVAKAVKLEGGADLGRPVDGGRLVRRRRAPKVGRDPDAFGVYETRRVGRYCHVVEDRRSTGVAP